MFYGLWEIGVLGWRSGALIFGNGALALDTLAAYSCKPRSDPLESLWLRWLDSNQDAECIVGSINIYTYDLNRTSFEQV